MSSTISQWNRTDQIIAVEDVPDHVVNSQQAAMRQAARSIILSALSSLSTFGESDADTTTFDRLRTLLRQ